MRITKSSAVSLYLIYFSFICELFVKLNKLAKTSRWAKKTHNSSTVSHFFSRILLAKYFLKLKPWTKNTRPSPTRYSALSAWKLNGKFDDMKTVGFRAVVLNKKSWESGGKSENWKGERRKVVGERDFPACLINWCVFASVSFSEGETDFVQEIFVIYLFMNRSR